MSLIKKGESHVPQPVAPRLHYCVADFGCLCPRGCSHAVGPPDRDDARCASSGSYPDGYPNAGTFAYPASRLTASYQKAHANASPLVAGGWSLDRYD